MAVIYIFFLRLLARGVPMSQIIIGVFAWQFSLNSLQDGMNAVTGNANLVKKVSFPRIILPVAVTLANLTNYLLSLLIQFPLILMLLAFTSETGSVGWSVLAVPLMILYQTVFNVGLAMLMSSSNVYFRDTQHLVGVLLSAWFFLSPVMYNLDLVRGVTGSAPWVARVYMLNPMACFIEGYRSLILTNVSFPWHACSIAGLLLPLPLAAMAYGVYQKAQKNFADLL